MQRGSFECEAAECTSVLPTLLTLRRLTFKRPGGICQVGVSPASTRPQLTRTRRMTDRRDGNSRRELMRSASLLVEHSIRAPEDPLGHGYSTENQIVIPCNGAFTWRTHGDARIIDANSVLFVDEQQEFLETHPIAGTGHAALIITFRDEGDEELIDRMKRRRKKSTASAAAMTEPVRFLAHLLLSTPGSTGSEMESRCMKLLDTLLSPATRDKAPDPATVVERTKRVLHECILEDLSLPSIAQYIGVAPAYLTQAFTRHEGIPLHRYLLRLRMNQALVELPRRRDITSLALELGFSIHSHFTAAFRTAFGVTPSQFRAYAR